MTRSNWPPYQTLRPLIHIHVGRPAIVMGGGPSMFEALRQAPKEAIFLSANDHGVRAFKDHPELGLTCHYVVAGDNIEKRARFDTFVAADSKPRDGKPWGVPVITRHMWADYRLLFMPAPSSGMAAAFCARLMGCSPIILMGMDLYAGGTYYDSPQAKSTGHSIAPSKHAQRWTAFRGAYPAQYRVIGCAPSLQNKFGIYSPKERASSPAPREQIINDMRAAAVRLKVDALISNRPFKSGAELEVNQAEAKNLERRGQAFILKDVLA